MIKFYVIFRGALYSIKEYKASVEIKKVKCNVMNIINKNIHTYRSKKIESYEYLKNYIDLKKFGYNFKVYSEMKD